MSYLCNIYMCKRKYCALCYCCNKNLCFNHLKEHRHVIQSQLNPLVDKINIIYDQLMIFNEQRYDLYNDYYNKRIDNLQKDIIELKSRINKLISEEDTNNEDIIIIIITIHYIKQQIEIIKKTTINDVSSPFLIDKFISTEQSKINQFDLSSLSSPFQTIICKNPVGSSLATNNEKLLMDQRFNLHVFDEDLIIEKQYQWKNNLIHNICWSSTLNNFIFITNNKQIYLVNDNITSIKTIQTIEEQDWYSSTCSDTSLFLTTNNRGTNIYEFNLSSDFQLIQQWKCPYSCQDHELIHHIVYNNEKLALIIEDTYSNMVHLELRLSTNLDLIWSFKSDIKYNLFHPIIRCCSLKYDQWIIIDSNNSRIFHITSDGKMKDCIVYKSPPWNVILLNSNIMAVRTENTLNFHKVY